MANPEITAVRSLLASMTMPTELAQLRTMFDGMVQMFPTAADVTLSEQAVGAIRAEWSATPGADAKRAVLYLHGGAYVNGSILSHRHLATEVGRAAGARALALQYRLAPEHPFPSAVDDALAAYRHLLASDIQPGHIAIAGDSAGGGLAVATLLAIKAAGLPQPACAWCLSPWVDLSCSGGTMQSKAAEEPLANPDELRLFAGLYLNGAAANAPLASPLYADLKGIAPLLIQVGSTETLLDDSVRLAGAAGAAEVPVTLEVWPEMLHVWHFFHHAVTDARRALAAGGQFIKSHMAA